MLKTVLLAVSCFCFAVFPTAAIPVPVLVGEGNSDNNSPASTYAFAQSLLTAYNAAIEPDLPPIPTPVSFDVDSGYPRTETPSGPTEDFEITVSSSFAYLLLKWGGADKNPHEVQLFYLGTPGEYSFDAPTYPDWDHLDKDGNPKLKQNGLSHYDFFEGTTTQVPEGGLTVTILGMGMFGLGALRRFLT